MPESETVKTAIVSTKVLPLRDGKYETLLLKSKKTIGVKSQKWMDETFRDINIEVNGFYLLNYLAYWALRIGGFVAWNKHRKVNAKIGK